MKLWDVVYFHCFGLSASIHGQLLSVPAQAQVLPVEPMADVSATEGMPVTFTVTLSGMSSSTVTVKPAPELNSVGAVRSVNQAAELTLEGRSPGLWLRHDRDYEEWGVGGQLRLDPGRLGLGRSLRLSPSIGVMADGLDRL